MPQFDQEVDVIVVGSGSAGLTAGWAAARQGLEALILEKAAYFGGSSALSGGGAWMPNAPVLKRNGQVSDPADVLAYLRTLAPEIDEVRHRRFLDEAPRLCEALETLPYFRNGYYWGRGYSDYHPDKGGDPLGRGIWPNPMDARALGDEVGNLRASNLLRGAPKGVWVTSKDFSDIIRLRWGGSLRRYKIMFRMAWRKLHAHATGAQIVTSGQALVARLRMAVRDAGVPLWLNTPMTTLLTDQDGAVCGVEAVREGKLIRIGARRGVVIAAGGFEFDEAMRRQHQPKLRGVGHSHGAPSNTGDGIRAGERIGAATDLMDDAWWMPAIDTPGMPRPTVSERQAPGQFIVNMEGRRFVNEAGPYTDFGHAQIAGDFMTTYMIMDHEGWSHNLVAGHMPGMPMPKDWLDHETAVVADTLQALAEKIGVPPANLVATAERFNGFAREGRDKDFRRGESAYDNFYGDDRYPNPNLAEVNRGPFYAFRMVLGDLGTKGGLLTDANAQVLSKQGSPIPGLFAAGNSSASVMGHSYAGPGATIGPAMTFGWIAANTLAGSNSAGRAEAA